MWYTLPCAHDFVDLDFVYPDVVMGLRIDPPVMDDVTARLAQVLAPVSYTIQDHMDGMGMAN